MLTQNEQRAVWLGRVREQLVWHGRGEAWVDAMFSAPSDLIDYHFDARTSPLVMANLLVEISQKETAPMSLGPLRGATVEFSHGNVDVRDAYGELVFRHTPRVGQASVLLSDLVTGALATAQRMQKESTVQSAAPNASHPSANQNGGANPARTSP